MLTRLMRLVKEEDGATAIEYGLLAVLISIVMIAGATLVGTNLNSFFTYAAGQIGTS
jgi:pilus assembly protein Flp/PilA